MGCILYANNANEFSLLNHVSIIVLNFQGTIQDLTVHAASPEEMVRIYMNCLLVV